jgi:Domain of unknown function (DUF4189)
MKSHFKHWLLIGLLLLSAGAVHAEEGCPAGQIPAGDGMNSCGPIPPGYYGNSQQTQPQPPPEKWVDHWGAIATFEPNGSLGTAINMPNQSMAEQAALTDCSAKHGSTCKIQLSYRNQCAAMVVGGKIFNVNSGPTVEDASRKGMAMCSTAANDCHIYYSACSLPQRIQ